MFSNEELKNLLVLVNKAPLVGTEATTVALLQQKLTQLISDSTPVSAVTPAPEAPAEDKKENDG